MRRLFSLVLIALLLQQTSLLLIAGPSRVAAKGLQQSQSPVAVLTNQDALNMSKAQLAPEIIVAKIRTSTCNFDTSPTELQRLIGLLWGFKRGEDAFISAGRRYDVFTSGNSTVIPLPETSK